MLRLRGVLHGILSAQRCDKILYADKTKFPLKCADGVTYDWILVKSNKFSEFGTWGWVPAGVHGADENFAFVGPTQQACQGSPCRVERFFLFPSCRARLIVMLYRPISLPVLSLFPYTIVFPNGLAIVTSTRASLYVHQQNS